jgi:hypothetical protein
MEELGEHLAALEEDPLMAADDLPDAIRDPLPDR